MRSGMKQWYENPWSYVKKMFTPCVKVYREKLDKGGRKLFKGTPGKERPSWQKASKSTKVYKNMN